MFSELVGLIVGVVGVGGTLASAILTQRSSLRAKQRELEHTERLHRADQENGEKQRRMERLLNCYVQLNAQDRNYRDAMLAYLHVLKAGLPGEAEAAMVATARRAQRDARAEAQMIAGEEVLDVEGAVNAALTTAYGSVKRIESEQDAKERGSLLDQTITRLDEVVALLSRVRVAMRLDLGTIDEPPAWY